TANRKPKTRGIIVAIDGPAGAGKSTVSIALAKKLGFLYVDTGAMYRALTLKALKKKLNLRDEGKLVNLAKKIDMKLTTDSDDRLHVYLDGEDVSKAIRKPSVTNNVHYIADVANVRKEMVKLQRKTAKRGKAVLEGRDIGTVVFPDADYKFYIDADIKERVHRRHEELAQKGIALALDEVQKDVQVRDDKDRTRKVGTLKLAENSIYVDTTKLSVDEVVKKLIAYIKK
ncbi:MAG: (d)CMP kinase, partial [Candidatus Omnitrophota bacterium]